MRECIGPARMKPVYEVGTAAECLKARPSAQILFGQCQADAIIGTFDSVLAEFR